MEDQIKSNEHKVDSVERRLVGKLEAVEDGLEGKIEFAEKN